MKPFFFITLFHLLPETTNVSHVSRKGQIITGMNQTAPLSFSLSPPPPIPTPTPTPTPTHTHTMLLPPFGQHAGQHTQKLQRKPFVISELHNTRVQSPELRNMSGYNSLTYTDFFYSCSLSLFLLQQSHKNQTQLPSLESLPNTKTSDVLQPAPYSAQKASKSSKSTF